MRPAKKTSTQPDLFGHQAPVSFEPRDAAGRGMLWKINLSAVARTFAYVAAQVWAESESLMRWGVMQTSFPCQHTTSLLWTLSGPRGLSTILQEIRPMWSLRDDVYSQSWSALYRAMNATESILWFERGVNRAEVIGGIKGIARELDTRPGILQRFLEEARSEEARALYELERTTG